MKTSRRRFLQFTAAGAAAGMSMCGGRPLRTDFPMQVDASLLRGHLLFEGGQIVPADGEARCDVVVVGAGVAGLSAARRLSGRDVVVLEVGDRPGGSSSSCRDESGVTFAQGAHYELPYPPNYGEDTLAFLAELGLIAQNPASRFWEFVDTAYLIDPDHESRTWTGDGYRADPLPKGDAGRTFARLMDAFDGKMPMPTRLIGGAYRAYNEITFAQWLNTMNLGEALDLRAGLDYQMRDDYGADAGVVSALAGIHYYQCRPYFDRDLKHFSPPQGNGYFVEKLLAGSAPEQLRLNHLVSRIEPLPEGGFRITAVDLAARRYVHLRSDHVVYAGQKHALKYCFPADADLFAHNRYAPWLTVALVVEGYKGPTYWQNEVLGPSDTCLGFVNSAGQHGAGGPTVLTCYFCLGEKDRVQVLKAGTDPLPWVTHALHMVHGALGMRVDDRVVRAHLKLHGHAMPIPVPGYLFRDGNTGRSQPGLVYAGVDNGRLPLFFEAVDSGLTAADLLIGLQG